MKHQHICTLIYMYMPLRTSHTFIPRQKAKTGVCTTKAHLFNTASDAQIYFEFYIVARCTLWGDRTTLYIYYQQVWMLSNKSDYLTAWLHAHTHVLWADIIQCAQLECMFCASRWKSYLHFNFYLGLPHTVEYISSAHGRGTIECSGWALNMYSSANGMQYPPTTLQVRNLHHNTFSTIISYHPGELSL